MTFFAIPWKSAARAGNDAIILTGASTLSIGRCRIVRDSFSQAMAGRTFSIGWLAYRQLGSVRWRVAAERHPHHLD